MLIDTHAHIDMDDYSADFQEMLKRAEENGVKKIIIPAYPVFRESLKKIEQTTDQ